MSQFTLTFDPARRFEVVNAYNAVEGILRGYGYVTEIVTVPADETTKPAEVANLRVDAQAPAETVAQPAADAGAAAPETPAEQPAPEQPAPDALQTDAAQPAPAAEQPAQ